MRVNIRIGIIIFLVILATLASINDFQPNRSNFLNFNEDNDTKSNSIASYNAINTTINIFTNKIEVSQEEVLFFVFTVCFSHNNSRITNGSLLITDLQTDRTLIVPVYTGTYSSLYENISWSISSSDLPSGWHTFQFNYTGFVNSTTNTEYLACSKEIDILVLDSWIYSNGNPIVMNITFLSAKYIQGTQNFVEVSLKATKNSYFRIKSYLTIIDKETGLILGHRVFSEDLSEYIITWQDLICINISIPSFLSPGNHAIRVFYSGSAYVCDHKYSYKDSVIFISGDAYLFNLSLSNNSIERSNDFESNIVDFEFSLVGSGLNNGFLELILFHSTDSSLDKIIIYSGIGISHLTRKFSFSHHNSSVGDYIIFANFTIFEDIFIDSITIRVFDEAVIDLRTNYTTASPGDELFIYGWVSEEDILTNSVNGTIFLYFGNSSNLLATIICNSDGYFSYLWVIPEDTVAQISNLYTKFNPVSNYYTYCESEKIAITITRNVNIVVYCSSGEILTRGDNLQFQVQVIDDISVITDGKLVLSSEVLDHNLITHLEIDIIDELTIINWIIPIDFPIGITTFIISYSGYQYYHNATNSYNIRILSKTNFVDVSINASDLTQGSSLEITGKLVDENNISISSQIIKIFEDQKLVGTAITNFSGFFKFLFTFNSDYPLGYHNWEITYSGDYINYNEIISSVNINFVINPVISLNIPNEINAGDILLLNITGRIFSQVSIFWKEKNWNFWTELVSTTLSSDGNNLVTWDVPKNVMGLFEFKVVDIDTQEFIIDEIKIYLIPEIAILVNNDNFDEILVGETLYLSVNSTSIYDIWIDGDLLGNRLIGFRNYPIIVKNRGILNITVHSYDTYSRNVKEELLVEIFENIDSFFQVYDYPDFKENEPIIINCSFASITTSMIEELPIIIKDNNTGMFIYSTFTNVYGEALLHFSLACGNYTLIICTPDYNSFLSTEYYLYITVKSQAKIIFDPISAYTEELVNFDIFLTSYYDNPLVNEIITLKIYNSISDDWSILGENKTDSSGKARITWVASILPGDYHILASYNGTKIILGVETINLLHIRIGEGPRLVFTNYDIIDSLDSIQNVSVNLLTRFESKVGIHFIKAVINNNEYFMKNSNIEKDNPSDLYTYTYSLSLILPVGEYDYTIIAMNSLNISSYWINSLDVSIHEQIKRDNSLMSVFSNLLFGSTLLSLVVTYYELKRRFN